MAAEPQQTPALEAEADDHFDDGDSALGASVVSSTTSIGSSILKHREENGRTYHAYKEGKYVFPNDEGENDRLDLQHHTFSLTYNGKLLTCPIDPSFKIHRLLDVGTGTGIWAMDYADEHPETKVIGVDLSPIQPMFTPPNLIFEIDDLEEPWTFHEKFDFIHSRMMTGSFVNWPRFFDQAFENLNSGGYLEISDSVFPVHCDDNSVGPDSAVRKWSELGVEAAAKIGRYLDSAKSYKAEMERVGFTDVVQTVYIWPMNRWPKDKKYKELGMWACENLTSGISGLTMALFTRVLGMTSEEVEAFLIPVRKELRDTKLHGYWPIYTCYGRKPLSV